MALRPLQGRSERTPAATMRDDLADARRVVIKVGSSSLTTADGGIDPQRIEQLVGVLARARLASREIVLVSSGAIAAGLSPLGLKFRPRDLATQQAAASVGQGLLMGHYTQLFSAYGLGVGQVLLANNDWYIIDFEGEPSRPLAESRLKASPLRDVAGMLRSFSYAKWSATKGSDLDEWEREARRAFLAAYAAATRGSGLFESFDDVAGLMKLFELEKVLYELRYELGNRPDWVQVPLSGLFAMLERKG